MESAFPTLKRGANKHCASGAGDRLLRLQRAYQDISHAAINKAAFIARLTFSGLKATAPSIKSSGERKAFLQMV
jgi:hypothetical protein